MASSGTTQIDSQDLPAEWVIKESHLSPWLINREGDQHAADPLICQNLSVEDAPFQTTASDVDSRESSSTSKLQPSDILPTRKSTPASCSRPHPDVNSEPINCSSPKASSKQSTGREVSIPPLEQHLISIADDLSDSDVEITDEKNCSHGARDEWPKSGSSISHPVIDDDPPEIIEELMDKEGLPPLQASDDKVRSAQRAVLNSLRDQASVLGPGRHLDEPEKYRLGQVQESPIYISDLVDVSQKFVASMHHDSEDNAWMEDDDDAGEAEEIEKLRAVEMNLKKRKALNQLSEIESYELRRASNQLSLIRRRKEVAERGNEVNDCMFVPESMTEAERRPGDGAISEECQPSSKTINDGQPVHDTMSRDIGKTTKRRKVAKNAREVEERRREKEQEKSKKGRPAQVSGRRGPVAKKVTKNQRSKKGGRKPQENKPRMKNGNRGKGMLSSLIHSDAIKERLAQENESFGKEPEIHERSSRKRQMDALMASIPNDYDIHKSRTQKSDIIRASKSFGFKKVVVVDGKWKLKGMSSPLYVSR
jgi:hypothetical protein